MKRAGLIIASILFVAIAAKAQEQTIDPLYKYSAGDDGVAGKQATVPAIYEKTATSLLYILADLEKEAGIGPASVRRIVEERGGGYYLLDSASRLKVYVHLRDADSGTAPELRSAGLETEYFSEASALIQGWIAPNRIRQLVELEIVVSVSPVVEPVLHAGSVLTQGDAVLFADDVRPEGFNGAGVCIGAISDGVVQIASAQSSGDVPSGVDIWPTKSGPGNEGIALLEIIHDIAPGATLAFASGTGGYLTMEAAIEWLATTACGGGADIIIDDVGYYDQPWYLDGVVAKKVDEVVSEGVTYITAAGNAGERHYEAEHVRGNPISLNNGSLTLNNPHDFGAAAGGASQVKMPVRVRANTTALIWLQWADPWEVTSQDIDLYLVHDNAQNTVATSSSTDLLNETHHPLEAALHTPTSTSQENYNIIVDWQNRPANPTTIPKIEFFCLVGCIVQNYGRPVGGIVGHQAAAGAITVGAVNHNTPNTIAAYSSRGPSEIYYPPVAGKALAAPIETRSKPEVVGPDGVSITGAGGFQNPFFGTSAAAPHIAGVAGLLLQMDPTITPAEMKARLQNTAIDLGTAGFDNVYGSGRVDALAAAFESGMRLYGDVSDNGSVSSADASTTLRHSIGLETLSGASERAAEVSGNGTIAAMDASLILQRSIQLINCFPVETLCAGKSAAGRPALARVTWGRERLSGSEREIPIHVDQVEGDVFAVEFSARLDGAAGSIEGLEAMLPAGWIYFDRIVDGELRVVMSGATPLAAGEIARIKIAASEPVPAEAIAGSARVNEEASQALVHDANVGEPLVDSIELLPNFPNPFNSTTRISYKIPEGMHVSVEVFDMLGRRVRTLVNERQSAGAYTIDWHASQTNVAGGVYWLQLKAGGTIRTRSVMLLK